MLERSQLNALEEKARQEYEEKLKAIRIVKEMLQEEGSTISELGIEASPDGTVEPGLAKAASDDATLIGSIEDKLTSNPKRRWTSAELRSALEREGFELKAKDPTVSINVAVKKLIDRGVAKLVRRGTGRLPNIYQAAAKPEEHGAPPTVEPAMGQREPQVPPSRHNSNPVGPTDAVRLVLKDHQQHGMTAGEVTAELAKRGCKPTGKSPRRKVGVILNRLHRQREVKKYKRNNRVKWKSL